MPLLHRDSLLAQILSLVKCSFGGQRAIAETIVSLSYFFAYPTGYKNNNYKYR